MARGSHCLLILALVAGACAASTAEAQVTRPRVLVGRFILTPDASDPTVVRVALSLDRRGAPPRVVSIATVTGPCTEDVGGLESLAVVRCESGAGDVRIFELMQIGARIAIDEQRSQAGGELSRVPRRFVGRVPRRFTFVPRCQETVDDPLACPPAR